MGLPDYEPYRSTEDFTAFHIFQAYHGNLLRVSGVFYLIQQRTASVAIFAAGSSSDRQLTTFQTTKVPHGKEREKKKTAGEMRLFSVINKSKCCAPPACAKGSDERMFVREPSVPLSKDGPPPRLWRQAVTGHFLEFH